VICIDCGAMEYTSYKSPRAGKTDRKWLLEGDLGETIGFSVGLYRYGEGGEAFRSPSHRHNFGQVRICYRGSHNFAPGRDIPEGGVGYFPAGVRYGPQLTDGCTSLVLQFGPGYLHNEDIARARQDLEQVGTFDDGIYVSTDAATQVRTKRDAVEAMYEYINGRKPHYPRSDLHEALIFDPPDGVHDSGTAGLPIRHDLGTFTERYEAVEQEFSIAQFDWSTDGVMELTHNKTQLVFLTRGSLQHEGKSFPAPTFIHSAADEVEMIPVLAGTSVNCIEFAVPVALADGILSGAGQA
jgi:hypothetical protein